MSDWLAGFGVWLQTHLDLVLPLLLSLGIAGWDLKSRKIPNYLTFGGALAGLVFQWGFRGMPGILDGLAGLGLGFFLLLLPYLVGGMGAGDVKASAALGAWLGLQRAFYFLVYMGVSGGLIILVVWLWQRRLLAGLRQEWHFLLNWVLCRPDSSKPPPPMSLKGNSIPYGVAMAFGMILLCWRPV
ncbi:MAG: A24 family peptidase [Thermodesulfobacteriota bacterium]